MLRITVELWPGGSPRTIKELATLVIANDGTGDQLTGNYKFWSFGPGEFDKAYNSAKFPKPDETLADHDRRENVWSLVKKALDKLGF